MSGAEMKQDEIVEIKIDHDGRLCVRPRRTDFTFIYRAGMEVGWDASQRYLFSPKPRDWTYPMWFRQILAAAAGEYVVLLAATSDTLWTNVPADVRAQIEAEGR